MVCDMEADQHINMFLENENVFIIFSQVNTYL